MLRTVLLLFLCVAFYRCSSDSDAEDCIRQNFAEYEIGEEACLFYAMYEYQGEYYYVFNCCVCGLIPMAIDCNGEPLCDYTESCMDAFFEDATFLFTFVDKE